MGFCTLVSVFYGTHTCWSVLEPISEMIYSTLGVSCFPQAHSRTYSDRRHTDWQDKQNGKYTKIGYLGRLCLYALQLPSIQAITWDPIPHLKVLGGSGYVCYHSSTRF